MKNIECPSCHYIKGKFCDLCKGHGFLSADGRSEENSFFDTAHNVSSFSTYANRPSSDLDVTLASMAAARKALEAQLDPRKLAYTSPDPDGEKRRLAALNLAMNAYQIANCPGMFGSPANNAMSWEDIVPLADRMARFVKGEGFSPHED